MSEQQIDPVQIEMLLEEIRQDPANEDEWARELIRLYRFQQALIKQWEAGAGNRPFLLEGRNICSWNHL